MLRHVDRYTQRKKSRAFTENPDLSDPVPWRALKDTPAQTHLHAKACCTLQILTIGYGEIYNNHEHRSLLITETILQNLL